MSKVLVASSIGPGKEYAMPVICDTLSSTFMSYDRVVVFDTLKPSECEPRLPQSTHTIRLSNASYKGEKLEIIQRVAIVRERTRKYFLEGDWSHLFFLDVDVVPPSDAVDRLLACEMPLATGIYSLREFSRVWLPAMTIGSYGQTVYHAAYLMRNVRGFGLGCMLIERSALEKTPFRSKDNLKDYGEDFAFCVDSGGNVVVEKDVSCWHVDTTLLCGRLIVEEPKLGAIWEGSTQWVINKFGRWVRGEPRYGFSSEIIAQLGPEFNKGLFTPLHIETADYADIIKEKK